MITTIYLNLNPGTPGFFYVKELTKRKAAFKI